MLMYIGEYSSELKKTWQKLPYISLFRNTKYFFDSVPKTYPEKYSQKKHYRDTNHNQPYIVFMIFECVFLHQKLSDFPTRVKYS